MRKIIFLFLLIFNLRAIDFVLIDSFNDAPNFPDAPIKAGDIDNDVLAEVIFTGEDFSLYNWIFIYERLPEGGFAPPETIPIYEPPSPWMGGAFYDFGIGDFDNDGKIEIFETTYNGNNFIEYFEIVESRFQNSYPDTIIWMDSLYIEGNNPNLYVWAGNFDRDNKTDILIYKGDGYHDLLWYENQCDNLYSLVLHWNGDNGIPSGSSCVGDLDLDSLPEMIVTDAADYIYPMKIYESVGNDSLINTAEIYLPFTSVNLYDVVFCGDVNNNGKPEVMIHGTAFIGMYTNRDDIFIIEATGDNQYEVIWCDSLYTPADQEMGCRSSAGDLTGDGIPEIVFSLTTGVRVIQYIPGQGYTYIWQKYYAWNTGNISTYVYDINNNGLNDMILSVQHQEENRVTYIYEKSPSVSEKYLKITPYFYVIPKITSDSLKIFYSLKSSKSADFYVYNISGEKIYSKKIGKNGEFYLNLKKLKFKPGIYFLRILSPEFKKTEKIIFWRK